MNFDSSKYNLIKTTLMNHKIGDFVKEKYYKFDCSDDELENIYKKISEEGILVKATRNNISGYIVKKNIKNE